MPRPIPRANILKQTKVRLNYRKDLLWNDTLPNFVANINKFVRPFKCPSPSSRTQKGSSHLNSSNKPSFGGRSSAPAATIGRFHEQNTQNVNFSAHGGHALVCSQFCEARVFSGVLAAEK